MEPIIESHTRPDTSSMLILCKKSSWNNSERFMSQHALTTALEDHVLCQKGSLNLLLSFLLNYKIDSFLMEWTRDGPWVYHIHSLGVALVFEGIFIGFTGNHYIFIMLQHNVLYIKCNHYLKNISMNETNFGSAQEKYGSWPMHYQWTEEQGETYLWKCSCLHFVITICIMLGRKKRQNHWIFRNSLVFYRTSYFLFFFKRWKYNTKHNHNPISIPPSVDGCFSDDV